jgi:hypothetical protein
VFYVNSWLIRFLVFYCALSSTAILIIVGVMHTQVHEKAVVGPAAASTLAVFTQDSRYMSLDPAFDPLWHAVGDDGALFDANDQNDNGIWRPAMFTM